MSARTIYKGSMSASILQIPICFYALLNSSNDIHFNQLCPTCHGKIKQTIGCPICNKTLSKGECLKGFPIAKDQWVILNDEEIESAHKEKIETIPLLNFVDNGKIKPIFNEEPYAIVPQKVGYDLFQLFRQSLVETGKTAIGKIIMRSKEYLLSVAPLEDSNILIGFKLHYAEDLRNLQDIPDYDFPQKAIDPEMLKLAKQLIGNLSGEWKPEIYRDEFRDDIMKQVEAKAQGIVIAPEPKREVQKQVNLMDALKQAVSVTAQATA